MYNVRQFQQRMQKFEHSLHHWNTIDSGLALVAIGLLFLTVGVTLRVHLNLIVGTVTCWCGILFIYTAVAVFTAVLKVFLDDTFGTDDY
jgi:cytochrome b subunit of formate dehydrogenase